LPTATDVDIPQQTLGADGKIVTTTLHVPKGGMKNGEMLLFIKAQNKESLDEHHKEIKDENETKQAGADVSRAATTAGLAAGENAEHFAQARKADAEAAKARAAANGAEIDWGPGGEKGFNSWHQSNVTPALGIETNYRLASTAYNEYKAAAAKGQKLPTGAQSMQMLSQHIATTFGTVKGARITKDMIEKHLGARSVSANLEAAVNRLSNGDALSKDQWDAYGDLISQRRNEQWRSVYEDAVSLGRPTDYIPIPPDLRAKWGLGPGHTTANESGQRRPAATQPAAAAAPAAPAAGGMVTVQLPGHPPGQIPAAALEKFQKDNPTAQVMK
jgi:hypothetical protein